MNHLAFVMVEMKLLWSLLSH